MNILETTLNLTNTNVSVLVIIAVVLYTLFTKDREAVDDKDERSMHSWNTNRPKNLGPLEGKKGGKARAGSQTCFD